MRVYAFERLDVWKEARKFVTWIYQTTEPYPASERFGLVSQMRRAAVSIVSNIAEGSARNSVKDQSHFYQLAYSSNVEVLNHLILSADLGFISNETLLAGRDLIDDVSARIAALRNSCIKKLNAKP